MPDDIDFAFEAYKLDREHELELNKATAAYEHVWIRTVTLLNGGAAGAFVTLLGVMWKADERPRIWLVFLALISWALGLVITTIATNMAVRAQDGYARGMRYWRNIEEFRRYGADPSRSEIAMREMKSKPAGIEKQRPEDWAYAMAAEKYLASDLGFKKLNRLNSVAVLLFILGLLLAAASVLFPANPVVSVTRSAAGGPTF